MKKKKKRKKLKSIKRLHKEAKSLMMLFVKLRDNWTCITCGKKVEGKHAQGGHFLHLKSLDFHHHNINCQCDRCNYNMKYSHKTGTMLIYREELNKKYGEGTAEALMAIKDTEHEFKRQELEKIISDLQAWILELHEKELDKVSLDGKT